METSQTGGAPEETREERLKACDRMAALCKAMNKAMDAIDAQGGMPEHLPPGFVLLHRKGHAIALRTPVK